jgi:hypothetical protein
MKANSISAAVAVRARTITTTRQLRISRVWVWTGFLALAAIAFEPRPAQAIAYSGAGVPLWTNRYEGQALGSAVAVDASGKVFVTGSSGGDYATIAYSGGRAAVDQPLRRTGERDDVAKALAVDANGNVFVTGSSSSPGFTGYSDYATIAYSSAGVPLWTNRCNGPGTGRTKPAP